MKPDKKNPKNEEALRLEIADELHDLMQRLRNIGFKGQEVLDQEQEHQHVFLNGLELEIKEIIREMKRIVAPFMIDPSQDLPVTPSERFRADLIKLGHQYTSQLRRVHINCPLSDIQGIPHIYYYAIHRIVENCVGNSAAHAEASEITVTLARDIDPRYLILSIADNGRGNEKLNDIHRFVEELQAKSFNHRGLGIILKQAERLSAKLKVKSTVGHGTMFSLIIPTSNNSPASRN